MACEGNTSYRRLACERRSSSGGNGTELLPGARGDARCRAVGRDGWRQPHTRQGAGQHLVANALAAKGCVGAWSRMGQNGMSVRVDVYVFAGERVRPGDAACDVFLFLWDTIRSVIELMRQGQLEPPLTRAHLQVQLAQALQELEKPWGRLG